MLNDIEELVRKVAEDVEFTPEIFSEQLLLAMLTYHGVAISVTGDSVYSATAVVDPHTIRHIITHIIFLKTLLFITISPPKKYIVYIYD